MSNFRLSDSLYPYELNNIQDPVAMDIDSDDSQTVSSILEIPGYIILSKNLSNKNVLSFLKQLDHFETCSICYDNITVYFSEQCMIPHYCCSDCWGKNLQVTCPICRKNIFINNH